jgi:hypothetical protein
MSKRLTTLFGFLLVLDTFAYVNAASTIKITCKVLI